MQIFVNQYVEPLAQGLSCPRLATTYMHDTLFNYIELKAGEKLTDNERDVIKAAFDQKRMRKRQCLLREGDICKYTAFIVKGSARMFSVDEKGQEHIIH